MKKLFSLLVTFIVGIAVGLGTIYFYSSKQVFTAGREVREMGRYRFINPLLECEVADNSIDARKENFVKDLTAYVQRLMNDRGIVISIYYRDLNNGPSFGIKETEEYIPASLLKVPIMMAYYHAAGANPSILDQVLLYEKKADLGVKGIQHIPPSHQLVLGRSYTVNELIEQAIIYSDNEAVSLLIAHVSEGDLRDLYQLLGVSETAITFSDGRMTVREYASFFRVMFNSSYLTRQYSEKALELLTRVDFKDGLVAGVPSDIQVAHKFGEGGNEDVTQIHDCGIIYATPRPYLLCVMTRGNNIKALTETIADLSRYVYDRVKHQTA